MNQRRNFFRMALGGLAALLPLGVATEIARRPALWPGWPISELWYEELGRKVCTARAEARAAITANAEWRKRLTAELEESARLQASAAAEIERAAATPAYPEWPVHPSFAEIRVLSEFAPYDSNVKFAGRYLRAMRHRQLTAPTAERERRIIFWEGYRMEMQGQRIMNTVLRESVKAMKAQDAAA